MFYLFCLAYILIVSNNTDCILRMKKRVYQIKILLILNKTQCLNYYDFSSIFLFISRIDTMIVY